MIEFIRVNKTYKNKVHALKNVSFKIDRGEFVFVIGPSGAGKSTFIKLLLKEVNPDSGKITLFKDDITKVRNRKIPEIRQSIGVVFQDFRLLENKTVYDNIKYVMELLGKSSKTIKKEVPQVLKMVNLEHKAKSYPNQLSGGEQQRVSIARAMVNRPKILIADEPTGNLDPETSWEIMEILKKINEKGTTVIMITHAKDIVDNMEKRVIHFEDGKVVRDEKGGKYLDEED